MNVLKANALSFACLLAMIAVSLIMYPDLPETVPMQPDINGTPGNYVPKQVAILIMPVVYAVAIAVINFMIRFSPSQFSMPDSQRALDIMLFGVGLILLFAHIGILAGLGDNNIFQQYMCFGLAGFLLVTGNVVGKSGRNFIFGIRIPWTLASTQNWRATHRFAGRLMVISGVLLLILSYNWASLGLGLVLSLGWAPIAGIYSFLFYLKNERPASE